MDIRQLHYFLVLCDEMNYSRAAQRLFLSRQALRQSISALEAELCGPLFLSAHHKLTLTDRGMSLQRHAAPVVEQFQQMQASLRAEIQSAQPVRIGISVSLVPDYLPGLETQLDKFRQQYPHVEMRFRMMDNDAVADDVEQGELDAGLVIDLGCAAPVLARTTLRADPACLLVPRGHAFWDKESIPLTELRGQRVLLPSLRQDLFSPLWSACARLGFAPNAEIGPSFYQAYYLVQEQLCTCLTRYEPGARRELDRVRDVLLEDLPPLCVSLVQRRDHSSAYISFTDQLLCFLYRWNLTACTSIDYGICQFLIRRFCLRCFQLLGNLWLIQSKFLQKLWIHIFICIGKLGDHIFRIQHLFVLLIDPSCKDYKTYDQNYDNHSSSNHNSNHKWICERTLLCRNFHRCTWRCHSRGCRNQYFL